VVSGVAGIVNRNRQRTCNPAGYARTVSHHAIFSQLGKELFLQDQSGLMAWSFSLDVIRLQGRGQCFDFVGEIDIRDRNHRVYLSLFEMVNQAVLQRV
jgi:hypothetical protein